MQTTRISVLRRPAVVPTLRLPGLRETAAALLRVLSGSTPSAKEAARIVVLDPVLVFELLQTNPLEDHESASLLEAIAQRIDNIDAGLLQAWALRHIVQQSRHHIGIGTHRHHCLHSQFVAELSSQIAREAGYASPDDAYSPGLLHDLRLMWLIEYADDYLQILADSPDERSLTSGLYLQVQPSGAKYWRMKYYFLGKEKLLALGIYSIVSLQEAREKRDNTKKLLDAGKDPSIVKKDKKRQTLERHKNTFEVIAREWHENQLARWSTNHGLNVMRRLEVDVFPYIGTRPISDIAPPELLDVLRKIEKRGALDVTARVKQISGQVFRYGIATGKCERDPSADLRGALKIGKTSHFASLDIKEVPEFLQTLQRNHARLFPRTQRAIKVLMLTFVRTGELINATWDEFDLEKAQWEIPGWRMKMRNPHIVPLSRFAPQLKGDDPVDGELTVRIHFRSQ